MAEKKTIRKTEQDKREAKGAVSRKTRVPEYVRRTIKRHAPGSGEAGKLFFRSLPGTPDPNLLLVGKRWGIEIFVAEPFGSLSQLNGAIVFPSWC
jgi:hypothetical protein